MFMRQLPRPTRQIFVNNSTVRQFVSCLRFRKIYDTGISIVASSGQLSEYINLSDNPRLVLVLYPYVYVIFSFVTYIYVIKFNMYCISSAMQFKSDSVLPLTIAN